VPIQRYKDEQMQLEDQTKHSQTETSLGTTALVCISFKHSLYM